jgi:hypothetical protein
VNIVGFTRITLKSPKRNKIPVKKKRVKRKEEEERGQSFMMQASPGDNGINQKLLPGVQGDGFLEKSPPGRRRQKVIPWQANYSK